MIMRFILDLNYCICVLKAYDAAVELRRIIGKAVELGKKVKEGAKKCKALTNPEDKKTCYKDLLKATMTEAKPLKEAYMKVRPTIIDMMNKFDECMAGRTNEVVDPMGAQECLPYVQEVSF